MNRMQHEALLAQHEAKRKKLNVLFLERAMRQHNLTMVEVFFSFSGSGDSGDINNIIVRNNADVINPRNLRTLMIPPPPHEFHRTGEYAGRWVPNATTTLYQELSLFDLVEEVANAKLNDIDVDWYNDNGGQGDMVFHYHPDSDEFTFYCEVLVNIIESVSEYEEDKTGMTLLSFEEVAVPGDLTELGLPDTEEMPAPPTPTGAPHEPQETNEDTFI